MLAESQLIGGRTEYYVLCGPGVPSLRLLWGAIRNRQLYILHIYCKGWISFNFSIFFIIYTIYRKKKLHAFTEKKLHDLTIFSYTTYIFHPFSLWGRPLSRVRTARQ